VYVQSEWPQRSATDAGLTTQVPRRLLASIEGLPDRLALPWPPRGLPDGETSLRAEGFEPEEIARLRRARAATEADFFNEGVPRSQLRAEGVRLPPTGEPEHPT